MSIKIIKGGLQTTIQDLGRQQYREFGIAGNGALDEYSHQIANWLVGNPKNKPTIEVTQIGPTLEFTEEATIAVAGAEFELSHNDQPCLMNTSLHMKQGDYLSFGKLQSGARAYVAISGDIKVEPVMDSASTNLMAGFGGHQGRALQDGDVLDIEPRQFDKTRSTPSELMKELHHNLQQQHIVVRFTEGREFARLSKPSQKAIHENNFSVSSYSNRMALKLEGEALRLTEEISMTTVPIVSGTIQLPHGGNPIVTLADGQTAGGYPRIGQVITADLSLLAQLKAGDSLSFYPVTTEYALSILKKKNRYIASMLTES
ncbi:biotin-dependent carboxyltransferase family protein [Kangiella sp. HD9-110m-PIT-SAG07]|nr:biotin-dependent carboxyltransferase family protein [Kangiella sp. HD9-110m-PIT-SAG07]